MWLILYCLWYGCCQWCGTVKPRLNIMFHNTFRVLTNVIVLIIYRTILFLENIKCNKLQWSIMNWPQRTEHKQCRPAHAPYHAVCARAADRPAGVHATAPATAERPGLISPAIRRPNGQNVSLRFRSCSVCCPFTEY